MAGYGRPTPAPKKPAKPKSIISNDYVGRPVQRQAPPDVSAQPQTPYTGQGRMGTAAPWTSGSADFDAFVRRMMPYMQQDLLRRGGRG